ncbi:diguanylate cyclase (GGDEF)-like protein/PAS domain S-box-containing protein [Catenuloplanes nepalensis]|uniref:Diguanylate cyclase (GGDEF)-like protein/PAS domain S-box-containing protein n=1 Tax=Catenuloplanes nepalensis TaxID=587533 RepID=A0ABT9N0R6_9ACTN|nr:EAL domain-containing protein [Catenuloplanes nepalensis]MDP9797289.1 diguanylate cyclase (GGDEF)-like protein/PAS domain S-box-containing protein [Catenuloplanes nepalensis]
MPTSIVLPAAGALLLAAGLAGLLGVPGLPVQWAACGAIVLVTAQAAGALIRRALQIHAATRTFGPCRGAGLLGMGAVTAGCTVLGVLLTPPGVREHVALGGLVASALVYLSGIMLLPGAATTVPARLRRAIDGAGVGTSLAFAAYLIPGDEPMPPAALAATLLAAASLSVIVITTLRVTTYRPAAWLCGIGAVAAILGLSGIVHYAYEGNPLGLLSSTIFVAAGPLVAADGARRTSHGPTPAPAGTPESVLSGYPVLAVPMLIALGSAIYHLLAGHEFDTRAVLLGLSIIPCVVLREILAVVDIRRYSRRLAAQEAQFRSLVSGANDLTLMLGSDLVVRWQSPAAARLFGLSDAEVVGRSFAGLLHPDDQADVVSALREVLEDPPAERPPLVTARLRDGYGAWRDTESTISDQRGVPEVNALVVHVRDVGDRVALQRQLHEVAYTDQLTGLPNRREIMRTLAAQRAVPGHTGALLVIELLGIADISDQRGRETADALLVEAGRRLRTLLTPDDLPGRLGGGEFAVLSVQGPVLAYALGTRLLTVLTAPYQLPGTIIDLHVSVGLAEVGSSSSSIDEVLNRADLARRRARQQGPDRIEWYDSYLEEQLVRRMDVEREIVGVIERRELDLVYQPILALPERVTAGVEALVRWRNPALGTVHPGELLPVAEDLGVMPEIGTWVLSTALRQLADWTSVYPALTLTVNVSPRELAVPDFVHRVAAMLNAHGIAPERLCMEVAEDRIPDDMPAVVTQFAKLRALGVRTAIDDFGAGQASLAQLRRMPVDMLKVDGELISRPVDPEAGGQPLIDVIVGLGRRLGLEIVAERLETTEQVREAVRAGLGRGQGFRLSRPAPAERVEAFLTEPTTLS